MDQNIQFLNAIYQVNKEEKDLLVKEITNMNVLLTNINNELNMLPDHNFHKYIVEFLNNLNFISFEDNFILFNKLIYILFKLLICLSFIIIYLKLITKSFFFIFIN